jgi:hypothetical protein
MRKKDILWAIAFGSLLAITGCCGDDGNCGTGGSEGEGGTGGTQPMVSDDFDTYTVGTYPSPPWLNMFSGASGLVSDVQSRSNPQSFRSESNPNWARWDYVLLPAVPDKLVYQAAVFLTSPDKGGAVGFGFVQPGTSSTGWWANAVHFANDGNVYFSTRTAGVTSLQNWTLNVWYEVEVNIDYENLLADVHIDGVLVGDDLPTDPKALPASIYGDPVPLDKYGMFGDNFPSTFPPTTSVIYYDDMAVAGAGIASF